MSDMLTAACCGCVSNTLPFGMSKLVIGNDYYQHTNQNDFITTPIPPRVVITEIHLQYFDLGTSILHMFNT